MASKKVILQIPVALVVSEICTHTHAHIITVRLRRQLYYRHLSFVKSVLAVLSFTWTKIIVMQLLQKSTGIYVRGYEGVYI